jgi:hypothetical protein
MARRVRHVSSPCVISSSRCRRTKCRLKGGWQVGFQRGEHQPIVIYLWNEADSYGRHPLFLTEEQRRAGSLTIPANLLKKPGKLQVWLIGEHKLGRLKLRKDITMVP